MFSPGWLLGTGTIPGLGWALSPLILLDDSFPALSSFLTHMHWSDARGSLCSSLLSGNLCQKLWPPWSPQPLSPSPHQGVCWTLLGPPPIPGPGDSNSGAHLVPFLSLRYCCPLFSDLQHLKPTVTCTLSGFLVILGGRVHLVPVDLLWSDVGAGLWHD